MLALGCSISGSGLEQLSALIVRLMAQPLLLLLLLLGPTAKDTGGQCPLRGGAEQFLGTRLDCGEKTRPAPSLSTLTEHDMDHIKGQVPQGHSICEADEKVEIG